MPAAPLSTQLGQQLQCQLQKQLLAGRHWHGPEVALLLGLGMGGLWWASVAFGVLALRVGGLAVGEPFVWWDPLWCRWRWGDVECPLVQACH